MYCCWILIALLVLRKKIYSVLIFKRHLSVFWECLVIFLSLLKLFHCVVSGTKSEKTIFLCLCVHIGYVFSGYFFVVPPAPYLWLAFRHLIMVCMPLSYDLYDYPTCVSLSFFPPRFMVFLKLGKYFRHSFLKYSLNLNPPTLFFWDSSVRKFDPTGQWGSIYFFQSYL